MLSVLRQEGVRIPDGFATTAEAYRKPKPAFLARSGMGSMSLSPHSVIQVKRRVAEEEQS